MGSHSGNGRDKTTEEWLAELKTELRSDEITSKHDREQLLQEIEGIKRTKQPSSPEVHVTVPVQLTGLSHHRTSHPPQSNSIEVHVPILGPIKAKGVYAMAVLVVVVAIGAWYAGRKSTPAIPVPAVPAAVK